MTHNSPPKIFLTDDHKLFAVSLQNLINDHGEYNCELIFKNGKILIDHLNSLDESEYPQLILLDVRMPVMDGVATMEKMREQFPSIKVLILTMEDDEDILIKMIKRGAKGYLLKDINPSILHDAISNVIVHGTYFTPEMIDILDFADEPRELNNRQLEFMTLICSDLRYSEIAEKMNVATKTVDNYRMEMFSKYRVKSRTGLVISAIRAGIFNPKL